MIATPHVPSNAPCAQTIAETVAKYWGRGTIHVVRDGDDAFVSVQMRDSGGQDLYVRSNGKWCSLGGGGGAMPEAIITNAFGATTGHRMYVKMQRREYTYSAPITFSARRR